MSASTPESENASIARPRLLSLRLTYPRIVLALDARLLAMTCVVGALAGLLAVAYFYALAGALTVSEHLGIKVPVYMLMPAAGILIGLCYRLGWPGETDAVVDNIHVSHGRLDTRANLPLIPVSLLSISAGGSAGPEAPMVYLTGSVGTWLQRWLKLPEQHVRTLTLTGMGVGFATLFGAPIGSALFALEIPHKRGLEYYEATIPSMIGCLVGYGVFAGLTHHGLGAAWSFPAYQFSSWRDLLVALAIGLGCGLSSFPFIAIIRGVKKLFNAVTAPMPIKAAVGGLLLGLVAWKLPATRFWGEEQLQRFILDARPALTFLLVVAAAKMVTIAITLAAGWRGGIIIPCFLIGACLGKAASLVVPGVDPTLAMLCGMTAINVAVMKVPLATVLVVTTMSGVNALAPVAVASFAAFVISGGVNFIEAKRERATAHAQPRSDEAATAESA